MPGSKSARTPGTARENDYLLENGDRDRAPSATADCCAITLKILRIAFIAGVIGALFGAAACSLGEVAVNARHENPEELIEVAVEGAIGGGAIAALLGLLLRMCVCHDDEDMALLRSPETIRRNFFFMCLGLVAGTIGGACLLQLILGETGLWTAASIEDTAISSAAGSGMVGTVLFVALAGLAGCCMTKPGNKTPNFIFRSQTHHQGPVLRDASSSQSGSRTDTLPLYQQGRRSNTGGDIITAAPRGWPASGSQVGLEESVFDVDA